LSLLFGVLALKQIKKRGQQGKGMAVAGLALSGIWTLALASLTVFLLIFFRPPPTSEAAEFHNSIVPEVSFDIGDCVDDEIADNGEWVVTPDMLCSGAHSGEVIGAYEATPRDGRYPGERNLSDEAEQRCRELAAGYLDDKYLDDERLEYSYAYPTAPTWHDGDRRVVCIVLLPEKIKGSMARK
jgi:hypothetical protein